MIQKYGIHLASVALILFTFIQCTESATDPSTVEAYQSTMEDLKTTPGFDWLEIRFEYYQPNASVINQIKNAFNPAVHKFYIFAAPACSCDNEQTVFPNVMKVLSESEVYENNYYIYVMNDVKNIHPFNSEIHVNSLPGIYLIKNDVPVFSIVDTLMARNINITEPNDMASVETIILEALQE